MFGAFDLVAQASRSEGLPNVLLEAAAAGRPIVATAAGGRRHRHRRRDRVAVPTDDLAALIAALRRARRRPGAARAAGAPARTHVDAAFGMDRYVAAFVDLYEERPRRKASGADSPSTLFRAGVPTLVAGDRRGHLGAQAFVKLDRRLPAQHRRRPPQVRPRLAHVTSLRGRANSIRVPRISARIARTSRTVTRDPPPTLKMASPGSSTDPARMVASTASATNVKSRNCSPSPYTSTASPSRAAAMKRENAISGRWRGP